jgi:class 3 adenylate cyclase
MKPYLDVHFRITIAPGALAEFASPQEVAEHAAQCVCSNSKLVSASVLPAVDLDSAATEIRAGVRLMTEAFQQVTSSESSVTDSSL